MPLIWAKMSNINCIRACGKVSSTVLPPLTFVDSNSDRQLRLNLSAHSIMFDTWALFCLVSISAVTMHYSPPSLDAFKLNEAPPAELGCFKLPKSQKSFWLAIQQTFPSSIASLTLFHARLILFCVVIIRETHLAGAPQGFVCADSGLKNLIRILVSHVIQAIPLKFQVPPVFSKACPHDRASSTLEAKCFAWPYCELPRSPNRIKKRFAIRFGYILTSVGAEQQAKEERAISTLLWGRSNTVGMMLIIQVWRRTLFKV